jgi:hypothetical protein
MALTTWTGSPLLSVQPQEESLSDYDQHEGYDPARRDEETAPEEPAPEPKKQPAHPKADDKPEPKKSDH